MHTYCFFRFSSGNTSHAVFVYWLNKRVNHRMPLSAQKMDDWSTVGSQVRPQHPLPIGQKHGCAQETEIHSLMAFEGLIIIWWKKNWWGYLCYPPSLPQTISSPPTRGQQGNSSSNHPFPEWSGHFEWGFPLTTNPAFSMCFAPRNRVSNRVAAHGNSPPGGGWAPWTLVPSKGTNRLLKHPEK